VLHLVRVGRYLRVADPDWADPLDGSYAAVKGGRWNAEGSFPVVYLNRDVETARANVRRLLAGQPFGIDDIEDNRRPALVHTDVPEAEHVDVVTDAGCTSVGLPASYPDELDGRPVEHPRCRPIGQDAWDAGEPGIACRSAAPSPWPAGEELAWFQRAELLEVVEVMPFERWFWIARPSP
jgi:hypothetical protein